MSRPPADQGRAEDAPTLACQHAQSEPSRNLCVVDPDGLPLLVFDGDCGFCTRSAEWASRGWSGRARTVPWQTLGEKGLAEIGLSLEQVKQSAWWVDQVNQPVGGHRAIGESLRACSGWRRALGVAVLIPPLDWIGPSAYRLVARYRYRLPGGTPACRVSADAPPTVAPLQRRGVRK